MNVSPHYRRRCLAFVTLVLALIGCAVRARGRVASGAAVADRTRSTGRRSALAARRGHQSRCSRLARWQRDSGGAADDATSRRRDRDRCECSRGASLSGRRGPARARAHAGKDWLARSVLRAVFSQCCVTSSLFLAKRWWPAWKVRASCLRSIAIERYMSRSPTAQWCAVRQRVHGRRCACAPTKRCCRTTPVVCRRRTRRLLRASCVRTSSYRARSAARRSRAGVAATDKSHLRGPIGAAESSTPIVPMLCVNAGLRPIPWAGVVAMDGMTRSNRNECEGARGQFFDSEARAAACYPRPQTPPAGTPRDPAKRQ